MMKNKKVEEDSKSIQSIEELEQYFRKNRSRDMLTVGDLVKWLKTLDQKACILFFDDNSNAWVEAMKKVPGGNFQLVQQEKIEERKFLEHWYCHDNEDERNKKIEEDIRTKFRYAQDNDVVMKA